MIIGANDTNGREETLAEASDRAKYELNAAFFGLCGFIMKEFKFAINMIRTVDKFEAIGDETLTFLHESFSYHCKAYMAAKKRYRERGLIVSPDIGVS